MIMARAELAKQGITPNNTRKTDYRIALSAAVKEIREQRSAGLGWGEIAQNRGLNWGKVVSEDRHRQMSLRATRRHSETTRDKRKSGETAKGIQGSNGHANEGEGAGKK